MPTAWRRGGEDRVEYVVVERNGVQDAGQHVGLEARNPTPTEGRILRRSYARRQMASPEDSDYESDDDDDYDDMTTVARPVVTGAPGFRPAMAVANIQSSSTSLANSSPTPLAPTPLANSKPQETMLALRPNTSSSDRDGKISQNTEHLLIAAGSIGATIIIVMIILGIYAMRKRGMSFLDVINKGKMAVSKKSRGPTAPPPKYEADNKLPYDEEWVYGGKDGGYTQRTSSYPRSGSLPTITPLQPLARSDSFKQTTLQRTDSMNRSFLLDPAPTHRRDISTTPSSPVLPIQSDPRHRASTQNTRSSSDLDAASHASTLPPPPTFRQFLSNRPSISSRLGPMTSRFSWTNSNAPLTPHDPSRDTLNPPVAGRDSFVTTRSSVPRFRTVDSWVNQQSNRIQEQRLKQQFRMTASSTYSEDVDGAVPEVPAVPRGLTGKERGHVRNDTVDTVFKVHPGTEVRFSTRSTVPSEVLDIGGRNGAL